MMVESYIALVLLALTLLIAFIAWADGKYHAERRYQRMLERERQMRQGL